MKKRRVFFLVLSVMLVIVTLLAIRFGAVRIDTGSMFDALGRVIKGDSPEGLRESVFIHLRLPRVLLCGITGAVLATAGVLLQGLFRNPLVEPGLIGTSSGAAFGASLVFVMAAGWSPALKESLGPWMVPLFAFGGGMLATWAVYSIARSNRSMAVTSLLLLGVAVNAMALSGTGFMSYIARDPQARSITFWNLGTFSGATWIHVAVLALVAAVGMIVAMRLAKQLNTLILGEDESAYLGVNVPRMKKQVLVLTTAMVAISTSFTGVIGFVGLIVPHICRLFVGSDNRVLLPAAILSGALLTIMADMAARLLLAPAEIPVGIITSFIGAPVFIFLLRKYNLTGEKGGYND